MKISDPNIYPNINLTVIYYYREIQFLDLTAYVENGFLKTKIFSKATDTHEYLDVRSSHQEAVFRSIPRTVANRVRRNCTYVSLQEQNLNIIIIF